MFGHGATNVYVDIINVYTRYLLYNKDIVIHLNININTDDQCSDQCENDNISDDVIECVINCTSVICKCLFVNIGGVPVVDMNTCMKLYKRVWLKFCEIQWM